MNATRLISAHIIARLNDETVNTRNDATLDTIFSPIFGGFMRTKDRAAIAKILRPITSPIMRLCVFLSQLTWKIAEPFVMLNANLNANREQVARFNARRDEMMTPRIYLPWIPKAYEEAIQPKKTRATKKSSPRTRTPKATVLHIGKPAAKKATKKTKGSKKTKFVDLYATWTYSELQWLAGEWGMKKNGKREELVARLIEEGKRRIEETKKTKKTA